MPAPTPCVLLLFRAPAGCSALTDAFPQPWSCRGQGGPQFAYGSTALSRSRSLALSHTHLGPATRGREGGRPPVLRCRKTAPDGACSGSRHRARAFTETSCLLGWTPEVRKPPSPAQLRLPRPPARPPGRLRSASLFRTQVLKRSQAGAAAAAAAAVEAKALP